MATEEETVREMEFTITSEAGGMIEHIMLYGCHLVDVQERWEADDVRKYRYYGALRDAHQQRFVDLLTLDVDMCADEATCPLFVYKKSEVIIMVRNVRHLRSNGHTVFDITLNFEGPDTSKQLFADFMGDARTHTTSIRERNISHTPVYVNVSRYWEHFNDIPYKDWDSVFLPKEQKEEIIEALDMFKRGKELCERKQVRYKFNMLLKGPPGGGKTTIVEIMAAQLKRSIYKFAACSAEMTDDAFQVLMSNIPPNSILLVEDADSLFTNHRERDSGNGITFSTFINSMDGVGSKNDLVTVLTTNHPEKLDVTLLRSSRIDRQFCIEGIRRECVAAMIRHWLDDSTSSEATTGTATTENGDNISEELKKSNDDRGDVDAFAKTVTEFLRSKKLSMASLQCWISRCILRGAVSVDDLQARIDDLSNEKSGETTRNYIQ